MAGFRMGGTYDEVDDDEYRAMLEEEAVYEAMIDAGKTEVFSYDDLFYDPDADENDEEWIQSLVDPDSTHTGPQAQERDKRRKGGGRGKKSPHLSCPACLSTLCVDCQQHEEIKTQFRSMFVLDTTEIVSSQRLSLRPPSSPRQAARSSHLEHNGVTVEGLDDHDVDIFYPVRCGVCLTEVGVFSHQDDVFHFTNVLATL